MSNKKVRAFCKPFCSRRRSEKPHGGKEATLKPERKHSNYTGIDLLQKYISLQSTTRVNRSQSEFLSYFRLFMVTECIDCNLYL